LWSTPMGTERKVAIWTFFYILYQFFEKFQGLISKLWKMAKHRVDCINQNLLYMYKRSKEGQCDNDNRSWCKRYNNIVSYEFLWMRRTCDIFSWMFTIATCCLVVRSGLGLDLVSRWLVLCTHTCTTFGCNCRTAAKGKLRLLTVGMSRPADSGPS